MNNESIFAPPPADVRDEILADHLKAYDHQGRMLKYSVVGNGLLAAAFVCALSTATWAITKERDHLYAVAIDPDTLRRTVIQVAGSTSTEAGRIAAADRWIREAYTLTTDKAYNLKQRYVAIAKLNSSPEDKSKFTELAAAEIDNLEGFVHTIQKIDFAPPARKLEQDIDGLSWDVDFWVKIEDRRENPKERKKTVVEHYEMPIVMKEVTPTIDNLDGLAITPFVPKKVTERTEVSNAPRK